MRRLIAQTFAIQGLGVILMFGVTLLVSRLGGAAAQGSFALVKGATDLLVAIFSLGLPPAIVFVLNSTRSGHGVVYRAALKYTAGLTLALPLLVAFSLVKFSNASLDWELALKALAIGSAGAWLTGFALLRGLLLVRTDGPGFSLISILQWVIIGAIAVVLLNRTPFVFELAYCAAGAVSLLAVTLYLRRFKKPAAEASGDRGLNWALLRAQSSHVLLQAILFGIQPFASSAALARWDLSMVSTGLFNIASMVVTLPNLLVALVAPVLFNRWSKSLDWAGLIEIRRNALMLGTVGQVCAVLAMSAVAPVVSLVFGSEFAGAVGATQILLLAVLPVLSGRILTPALQGLGLTHVVSRSCLARFVVGVIAAGLLALAAQPALGAIAWGWVAGEYAALVILLVAIGRTVEGQAVS